MLKEGNQLAMIVAVTVEAGKGKAEGLTVCRLQMRITQGDARNTGLSRRYFYRAELPDSMRIEFLRMGYAVKRTDDVETMQQALLGKIALVSIRHEGDRLRCYLEQYMGSDDPARVCPQNNGEG